jgi:arabinose-5-phosphate isomerase
MGPGLLATPVVNVMTKAPQTTTSDTLAAAAVARMVGREGGSVISSLVVVDQGNVVGLIRLQECLQAGLV